jgi:hypothetical protein
LKAMPVKRIATVKFSAYHPFSDRNGEGSRVAGRFNITAQPEF